MSRLDCLADCANDVGNETYGWVDKRFNFDTGRALLEKASPAEDPFLLDEVALFCFLFLVLTGIFLGMSFELSASGVEYEGNVAKFRGQEVSKVLTSVLHITCDIPFGMFIRRMHHWAAHLFVASIGLHMLRVFFTGAHRSPCKPNRVVGVGLTGLFMSAAYAGYALLFDESTATATDIGYSLATSIPLIGDVVRKAFFGGEFPPSTTILRLCFLYILVTPMAIGRFLAIHAAILVHQRYTEAPCDGDV